MLQIIWIFFLVSCGGDESEELNKNNVTLSPDSGTYQFRPWVLMTKEETGLGSGVLNIKSPGDTDYQNASFCPSHVITSTDFLAYCSQITETGTLFHYLQNTGGKSDERSAEYVVELQQNDLTIGKLSSATATESTDHQAIEKDTICYLSETKMNTVIQFTSEQMAEGYVGYFIFSVNDPTSGKTIVVNQDNTDLSVTIGIFPTSDKAPSSSSYLSDNYTTYQSLNYSTGVRPSSSCTISIIDFERNGITKGNIVCSNLANYDPDLAENSSKIPFGKHISASFDWQCDEYQDGAY